MGRLTLIHGGGNDDQERSTGQKFQCDCPNDNCGCGAWGYWVPAGQIVPRVVLCFSCAAGNHS